MEVSRGPPGRAGRPFTGVLFTCWISTTLDLIVSTRAAQNQDLCLCHWNNKTTRLILLFCFFFPSQQNTELSVQADKHPEAASKDRVGGLTLVDKVSD